jgi:hypothetical protein
MKQGRLSMATEDDITQECAADALLHSVQGDSLIKALDVFGWKVVAQDPDQPAARWTLTYRHENCPTWCHNGDQDLPEGRRFWRHSNEWAVWWPPEWHAD